MVKERLTQRNEFGNAEIILLNNSMSDLYGALLTYKERDALTDALNKLADYEDKEENREAPLTADVQEVRPAEWVLQENKHPEAVCSNCGREVVYQIVNNRWEFENYCPHCGAKMDKE